MQYKAFKICQCFRAMDCTIEPIRANLPSDVVSLMPVWMCAIIPIRECTTHFTSPTPTCRKASWHGNELRIGFLKNIGNG